MKIRRPKVPELLFVYWRKYVKSPVIGGNPRFRDFLVVLRFPLLEHFPERHVVALIQGTPSKAVQGLQGGGFCVKKLLTFIW